MSRSCRPISPSLSRYLSTPYPIPPRGTPRNCSFTRTNSRSSHPSPPSTSNTTGYVLVNQPTVRDTSTSLLISSRPCPSTSTTIGPPLHSCNNLPNPVSSTSLICV